MITGSHMTTLQRLVLSFLLFALTVPSALAQEDGTQSSGNFDKEAYEELRAKGVAATERRDYAEAMQYFVAALIPARRRPEHDLDSLIAATLDDWARQLSRTSRELRISNKKLKTTNTELEKNKEQLEAKNAALTQSLSLNTAYRLALLSEGQRTLGKHPEALFLAYQARGIVEQLLEDSQGGRRDTLAGHEKNIARIFGNALTPYAWRGKKTDYAVAELTALPAAGHPRIAVNLAGWQVELYRLPAVADFFLRPQLTVIDTLRFGTAAPVATAYSPDGRLLLSYGHGAANYRQLDSLTAAARPVRDSALTGVAFFPGGKDQLLLDRGGSVHLLPGGNTAAAQQWQLAGKAYEGAFSPDGRYVLTRTGNRKVEVWAVDSAPETGEPVQTIEHANYVYSACFSPDGRYVLTAGADRLARLTPVEGGAAIRLPHAELVVKEARFSPQGDRIFSRTLGSELFLWDKTGSILDTLSGHSDRILAARWSPDGQQILTTSADGNSLLWDRAGNIVMQIPLNNLRAPASVFSPDGQFIVAVYGESEVRVYPQPRAIAEWLATGPNYSSIFPERDVERWKDLFTIE